MDKKLYDAFEYAIESGNIELFDVLAKNFDKLSQEDRNEILENTVVDAPDTEFIQHVLDYGFDINYVNESKNTLLHFAAVSSHPETVRFFIEKGLDLEAKNDWDGTPLFAAVKESDSLDVIKALIDAGAEIHGRCQGGETLLITAAGMNPNPEITEFLIKKGFDLEEKDDEGLTPFLNAAFWQSNSDVMDLLIDSGANIKAKTKRGDNAFHLAAFNPEKSAARFISPAFMTDDRNNYDESCMEKVLKYGRNPETLKVFLKKMKEEQVMYACGNENPEILETLIESGYDANTIDANGMSAMMLAARINENPVVIKMLMYKGASEGFHDFNGRNVVHYAASNTCPDIYNWMKEEKRFSQLIDEKDSKGNLPEFYRTKPDEF